jgi:hypothetical protein
MEVPMRWAVVRVRSESSAAAEDVIHGMLATRKQSANKENVYPEKKPHTTPEGKSTDARRRPPFMRLNPKDPIVHGNSIPEKHCRRMTIVKASYL